VAAIADAALEGNAELQGQPKVDDFVEVTEAAAEPAAEEAAAVETEATAEATPAEPAPAEPVPAEPAAKTDD
jgi:hypothetical protein